MSPRQRMPPPVFYACTECKLLHSTGDPCMARVLRLALNLEYSHNPAGDSAFVRRVAISLGDADTRRLVRLIDLRSAVDRTVQGMPAAAKIGALLGGALGAAFGMAADAERGKMESEPGGPRGGVVIPSACTDDQAGGGAASQSGASPLGPPGCDGHAFELIGNHRKCAVCGLVTGLWSK